MKSTDKKVPKSEVKAIYFHLEAGIFGRLLNPIKSKKTEAKIIRKEPNCKGFKPISPFFININELPQTKDRAVKYTHFICFDSIKIILAKIVTIL